MISPNEKYLRVVSDIRKLGDTMSIDQLNTLISRLIYDRDVRSERRRAAIAEKLKESRRAGT